jgi:hypothetical protein
MLAIGLQQSQRRADLARPYGYGFEQYVWAMISGVSTFILGAGASVYHGATLLMHPGELESLPTAVAVLGAAGILESYTLSVAWQEMKAEAKKLGITPYQCAPSRTTCNYPPMCNYPRVRRAALHPLPRLLSCRHALTPGVRARRFIRGPRPAQPRRLARGLCGGRRRRSGRRLDRAHTRHGQSCL